MNVDQYKKSALRKWLDGDEEAAIDDLTSAIELDPSDWNAYASRAFIYKETGQLEASLKDTKKANQLTGTDWDEYHEERLRNNPELRLQEEKKKEVEGQVVFHQKRSQSKLIFPAGFYHLGDATNAFENNRWKEIYDIVSCGQIVTMESGNLVASICLGSDGCYPDNEGNYYCTEQATISLIPLSEIDLLNADNCSYIYYKKPFKVKILQKSARFGGVTINGRAKHQTNDAEIIGISDEFLFSEFLFRLEQLEKEAIEKRKRGDIDGALEILKMLYRNDRVLFNLGFCYQLKNEFNEAIRFYKLAIDLEDKDSAYYNNRACCYVELGEFLLAINDFDKAIKINPKESSIYLGRSEAHDALGNTKQAFEDKRLANTKFDG